MKALPHLIGHNVQLAVDAKHHLVVAEAVVPAAADRQQLAPLAGASDGSPLALGSAKTGPPGEIFERCRGNRGDWANIRYDLRTWRGKRLGATGRRTGRLAAGIRSLREFSHGL